MPQKRKKRDFGAITNSADLRLMKLKPSMFHPVRFLIMKTLAGDTCVDFRELRQALGRDMPTGNLASHLRALERENFVTYQKRVEGREVYTGYALTPFGRSEYHMLQDVLAGWTEVGR